MTPPPAATTRWEHLGNMLLEAPWTQILSVMVVIGAMIFVAWLMKGIGADGVANVANKEYARGLITVLFAVGTIGIALLAIFTAIFTTGTEAKERFDRAKEILSLLLGIFGTIIGFYFGNDSAKKEVGQSSAATAQTIPQSQSKGSVVPKLDEAKKAEQPLQEKAGDAAEKSPTSADTKPPSREPKP